MTEVETTLDTWSNGQGSASRYTAELRLISSRPPSPMRLDTHPVLCSGARPKSSSQIVSFRSVITPTISDSAVPAACLSAVSHCRPMAQALRHRSVRVQLLQRPDVHFSSL